MSFSCPVVARCRNPRHNAVFSQRPVCISRFLQLDLYLSSESTRVLIIPPPLPGDLVLARHRAILRYLFSVPLVLCGIHLRILHIALRLSSESARGSIIPPPLPSDLVLALHGIMRRALTTSPDDLLFLGCRGPDVSIDALASELMSGMDEGPEGPRLTPPGHERPHHPDSSSGGGGPVQAVRPKVRTPTEGQLPNSSKSNRPMSTEPQLHQQRVGTLGNMPPRRGTPTSLGGTMSAAQWMEHRETSTAASSRQPTPPKVRARSGWGLGGWVGGVSVVGAQSFSRSDCSRNNEVFCHCCVAAAPPLAGGGRDFRMKIFGSFERKEYKMLM